MSTDAATPDQTGDSRPERIQKKAAPRRSGGRTHVKKPSNAMLRHAAPFLICGGAWPVAEAAHLAWGTNGSMLSAMGAGALGLTWFTHRTWHKRHEDTQALATVFAGAVSGWTVLAADTNPFSSGMLDAWELGGVLLSAAWLVRAHGLASPHEADKRTRPDNGLGRWAQLVQSLKGAKVLSASVSPDGQRVSARVRLEDGVSVKQVQADKDTAAAAMRIGADQVSVVRVPGDDNLADLSVTAPSQLGSTLRWTPPADSELGLSVADKPFIIGMRADGRPIELWGCGQDTTDTQESRILGHVLCTGQTGSGKTETVRNVIVFGRDRRDFVPVIGDPEKFGQSFGDISDALGLAAKDEKSTRRLIRNLPAAVRYRADLMGSLKRADGGTGYKQWVPECYTLHGIPLLMVDIEEAATVLDGDNDDFDKTVRTARSVGIWVWASMQTAHHSNMERKTRGQFPQSLTHGAKELQDAKFALSPGTLEAGADPTKWGGNSPGSLYAEVVGTPQAEWAVDARSFWISPADKRKQLDRSKAAGHWAVIDPGTYAALADGVVEDAKPDLIIGGTGSGKAFSEYPEFDFENESVYVNETDEEEEDVTAPIEPSKHERPFPLGIPQSGKRLSVEDAQEVFDNRLRELEEGGTREITFANLADLPSLVGRQRSWVYDQLERVEAAGRLRKVSDSKPLQWTIEKRLVMNGHTRF